MSKYNEDFASRLKRLRLKLGMTQQQLADKVGVTRCSISNWESQKCYKITSTKKLSLIANVLQVDATFLMYGEKGGAYTGVNDDGLTVSFFSIPVYNINDYGGFDLKRKIKFASRYEMSNAPNKDCFKIVLDSNDMESDKPGISFSPGSIVSINPIFGKRLKSGSHVFVRIDKKNYFRQVKVTRDGTYLSALNDSYPDIQFEKESGDMIIGVAYEHAQAL